jgi:hypothetical protein
MTSRKIRVVTVLGAIACSLLGHAAAQAQTSAEAAADAPENFAIHAQSTYVWQRKPGFDSPYEGSNSLSGRRAKSYSFTATVDLGLRLWEGGEFHYNEEASRGAAFSGLHGLGGLSNGELAKTSGAGLIY